jgi:hypothetical protein
MRDEERVFAEECEYRRIVSKLWAKIFGKKKTIDDIAQAFSGGKKTQHSPFLVSQGRVQGYKINRSLPNCWSLHS